MMEQTKWRKSKGNNDLIGPRKLFEVMRKEEEDGHKKG